MIPDRDEDFVAFMVRDLAVRRQAKSPVPGQP